MNVEFTNLEDIVPTELIESLSLGAIEEVIKNIADAARHEWVKIAGEELFTSRNDYLNGIQKVAYKNGVATIALLGELPNLIEQGMEERDMHDTLLGPQVPVVPPGGRGKQLSLDGGFYRSIPFRHGTPGTKGGVGPSMGRPYGGHEAVEDAKKLGRKIYRAARKLKGSTSDPEKGTNAYGGRLPAGLAPKLRPYHTTDIYAGMIREEKTYHSATQSQYVTFRTIAVGPDGKPRPNNPGKAAGKGSPWIRPATPGKNFAGRVNDFVQKIATQSFEQYVESLK